MIIIFPHFPHQNRNFGAPPQRQRKLLQLLRLFASVRSGFQLFSPRRVLLIRMAIWGSIPHFPSAVNHHGFVEFLGRFDPFWLRGIEFCDAAESQVKISHLRFDRLPRTHLEGIHPCAGRFLKRVWAKQQPEASQMVISCHLD